MGSVDRLMGGWMDGWMYGWMDGWMDGWMWLVAPSLRNYKTIDLLHIKFYDWIGWWSLHGMNVLSMLSA